MMKPGRDDVQYDHKQVLCRNASMLGFSSVKLHCKDFFIYTWTDTQGNKHQETARMIHRIKYAPALLSDPRVHGWIIAQVISQDLTFTMERWVNPDDVVETIPNDRMPVEIRAFFDNHDWYR